MVSFKVGNGSFFLLVPNILFIFYNGRGKDRAAVTDNWWSSLMIPAQSTPGVVATGAPCGTVTWVCCVNTCIPDRLTIMLYTSEA